MPLPTPPRAEERPHAVTTHGHVRHDAYHWLRADNWQEALADPAKLPADIRAHLEAENAYCGAVLAPTKALQDRLFEEMRSRIKEDDESLPVRDGDWQYYARHREGGNYALLCRRWLDGEGQPVGEEQLYFDGDTEGEGKAYFALGSAAHSPDHRWLAYAVDTLGSEKYVIRFRDLETGAELDQTISDTAGSLVWAEDNRTILYVERDDNNRPYQVRRYHLGEPPENAEIVFTETDPGFFVSIGETESRRFLTISSHNHTTSEIYLLPAHAPDEALKLVAPREDGVEYGVSHRGDELFILTNADGATDFKIVRAPLDAPGRANWRDWIGHRPGVLIVDDFLREHFHIRLERENALPRIVVHDLDSGEEHAIAFSEEAYALGLGVGDVDFASSEIRFSYASPTTPDQTFDYDLTSRSRTLRKTRAVPSGHNPADYVVRRIEAVSHDGACVPATILHHVNTPVDGTAPALLYGYGSYGISLPASFSTNRLSLVDRGVVHVVAHLRGGMEKGYQWYLDGKLEKKTNTFHDFLAVARMLNAQGYAAPGRIAIMGGSAGGLLVGAALNMAPDLFAGCVAQVPFVDVVTTMLDADLPLTPPEWPEWGNPIEDEAAYHRMVSYAPYENVAAKAYPPVLITAGVADPRVTYWEPAKWAARLRARSTSRAPILLKTNLDAGHGGASARWDSLREVAEEYAFVLAVLGDAEAALARD